ncbi:MAG: ribose-phosphate pyrophosphokinase-like domain-containing protein, partial [Bacteroidia bacterium]
MRSNQANAAPTPHGMKIFAGQATLDLGGRIAQAYGDALGDSSLLRFSDGEFQPVINESVR